MTKGHRAVTETGRAGGGGRSIPSATSATAQPVAEPAAHEARLSGNASRRAVQDALAIVPMIITRIELWKTERLVPLERNPRTHEVYRARDPRLKRDIAIKVLPADMASAPDWLARFEREATTVAGLNHPNIVTLYSIEEDGGTRFLTMELVEGQSLADLVTPGGLPAARVIELGIAVADALAAAHEKGVVHRDLKPANVMLTDATCGLRRTTASSTTPSPCRTTSRNRS